MNNPTFSNDLIDQHEVAKLLGLTVHTIRYWRKRSIRQGPPWLRLGYKQVRYDRAAVLEFANRRRGETYRAAAD